MATEFRPDSKFTGHPLVGQWHIGLVVSEWNEDIMSALRTGALDTLHALGVSADRITEVQVPGSYELSVASQWLAQRPQIEGVIALGCVIQGDTDHHHYINQAVSEGLTRVSLNTGKPVMFGLLTTRDHKQAKQRAGGRHGNKGEEAAHSVLKMIATKYSLT